MPNKHTNYFGPSLDDSLTHTAASTSLTRFEPIQAITPREGMLFEEATIQSITIEAQATKAAFAQTKLSELHQLTTHLFSDTLAEIVEVQEMARGREHQAIVDEFTRRQISVYGRQSLGMLEVGGTSIAMEVSRSLYVPPPLPEPKRRGLLARLLGPD